MKLRVTRFATEIVSESFCGFRRRVRLVVLVVFVFFVVAVNSSSSKSASAIPDAMLMASSAASAMSSSSESARSTSSGPASRGRMVATASIAASSRSLPVLLELEQCGDVRPRCVHLPVTGGRNRFVVNPRVRAFQGFQYLLFETANVAHAEDGRQFPLRVVARVGGADRLGLPVFRRAHGCFKNAPPRQFRDGGCR